MSKASSTTIAGNLYIRCRNSICHFLYTRCLKPCLFLIDPERVHESALILGKRLGSSKVGRRLTHLSFFYSHPSLQQSIHGINFPNPVGLAAGFDKNGVLTGIIPDISFGFMEIGSVTGTPCSGNAGDKLWRLKKSKSIVVNYGLKNVGAEAVATGLKGQHTRIPLGISLAKANNHSTVDEAPGIDDYIAAYRAFASSKVGDYFTLNISCPNACGGQPFLQPGPLRRLLEAFSDERSRYGDRRPWFIKLSADLYPTEVDGIINAARPFHPTGFICSNLTKNRRNHKIRDAHVPEKGGLSGAVVAGLSDNLIKHIYAQTGREFVIIGCGGIFSAEDAYRKIKLGASLLQLITGMIFEGPQLISEINRGLVKLLKADGYESIAEAIGQDVG